jgi:hypothetical protein
MTRLQDLFINDENDEGGLPEEGRAGDLVGACI